LQEVLERYKGLLYCYCLMTNHTHLMIETGEIVISEIMKRLNEMYVKYFNIKYNLVGHLFQGRYFQQIIESDSHILDASKYIHLNPVKAKMVNIPEEYTWSSYSMYIGLKKEKLITSGKVLPYFKGDSRLIYKEYVERDMLINEDAQ